MLLRLVVIENVNMLNFTNRGKPCLMEATPVSFWTAYSCHLMSAIE